MAGNNADYGPGALPPGSAVVTGGTISGATIGPTNIISVTATGSPTPRTLSNRFADFIYAADYGVAADGVTDDTASLQAAINAAQATWLPNGGGNARILILPRGYMQITGLTVNAPVTIQGQGRWGSVLRLATGTTIPAITVSISVAQWGGTAGFESVDLRDFQITSPNRTDAPGLGVAHGLSIPGLASPSYQIIVRLFHMLFMGMPGDAIHHDNVGGTSNFSVEAYDVEISYPGGYGIYAASATDWVWTGGAIGGAVQDNILLSGCYNMRFTGLNVYIAQGRDINCFNSEFTLVNGIIDETGTDGLAVNNVNGLRVDIVGCILRWSGINTNATYSPLRLLSTNTGDVYLTACNFPTPASSASSNKPLNNIQFDGGNTGKAYLSNCNFDLGPVNTTGVTNTVSSVASASFDNGAVGSITPSTGAFTTLAASSTVSGTGFINRLATPGPVGNTVASTGAFTTLAASSTVSGTGFSTYLASPPAIGGTTPASGKFTTVDTTGEIHILSATQFTGMFLSNGGVNVWNLFGSAATNDNGALQLSSGGSVLTQIVASGPSFVTTGFGVGGSAGPTWTSGTGVPATTTPKGSMFSRTDGAVGSTLYVSQGAGTWNAVALV